MDMLDSDMLILSIIIVINLAVNTMALVYLLQKKKSASTLKDSVITSLCLINLFQSSGFGIELKGAITGSITKTWCKIAGFEICSLTYTSIGYFIILAIERYVAIIHPYQYTEWFTFRTRIIYLFLPPLYGSIIGAIPLIGWGEYSKPRNNSIYCTFNFRLQSTKSYFIFTTVIVFVIPIVLTFACFIRIFLELRNKVSDNRRVYGRNCNITTHSLKSVLDQSLSSSLAVLVYICSWLPYCVVCFEYFADRNVSTVFEHVAKFLSKSSTISSIVVYCLIERKYRSFLQKKVSSGIKILSNHLGTGIVPPVVLKMTLINNHLPSSTITENKFLN